MIDLPFLITFDKPWFLLLLLLLPVLWYFSFDSLAGLGQTRRWLAIVFRSLVVTLLVMALAQAKWQLKTDRLTVIYLLDQSQSIPADIRQSMVDYVIEEVDLHRREKKQDRAGLIVFGADAKIESAPYDGRLPVINRLESADDIDGGGTSLEAALKLAKASFPEGSARRVVIISDGNENLGDARSVAQAMAEDGIGIDVIPVELLAKAEVSVEKVSLPTDVRKDQKFQARVILSNEAAAGQEGREVTGTLRLTRKMDQPGGGQVEQLIAEEENVVLQPGKNIIGFNTELNSSGIFATEAEFIPDDKSTDLIPQNNKASAFTRVQGKGKVLLIEDAFDKGEFVHLAERLRTNSIEIVITDTSKLYSTPAELLQYDAVILANTPRSSSAENSEEQIAGFSDAQVKMLVDNCEQMGCGIIMLGGERAMGAGAWSNSLLEDAMPVDFQIKNDKVSAVGALAMVMHACEMPNGNRWQVKIGEAALDVLGPMDYCGVVEWTGTCKWLWKMPSGVDRVFENKAKMKQLLGNMTAGDMPDFQPAMRLMLNGLLKTKASMRHAIIISDGDPNPPTNALLAQFKQNNIKISTVGVGTHGAPMRKELKRIADATGGKYWNVTNPKALPKIYQREARRVAKPVIRESPQGMSAVPVPGAQTNEIVQGIDVASLPPFYGYVMSTIKKSALVEQLIVASEPSDDDGENSTLLASWRYGNGRTVVFSSDAGNRWTSDWFSDPQYDKLFVQMVRYAMRPITEFGDFTVATDVKDGVARILVTALDQDEQFINFLEMHGTGIYSGADAAAVDLSFKQIGPGRYVAQHQIDGSGSLLYSIFPGEGYQKLTAGVSVPYSNEYSDRQSNMALLQSLASFEPTGGEAGMLADVPLVDRNLKQLLDENTFRPTLTAALSIQDIWPFLLLLGSAIFFTDVFVRRVSTSLPANLVSFSLLLPVAWLAYFAVKWFQIRNSFEPDQPLLSEEPTLVLVVVTFLASFAALFLAFAFSTEKFERWVAESWASIRNKERATPEVSLSRLQSRKAEIEKEIEARRAATRFEPDTETGGTQSGRQQLEDVLASEIEKTPALPPKIVRDKMDVEQDTSYTSRLLDAKKKAQQKRNRGKGNDAAESDPN